MAKNEQRSVSPQETSALAEQIKKTMAYYHNMIANTPKASPLSVNAHLKLGKLYVQLGDKAAALNEYFIAAVQYTHRREVVKALAVHQMIKQLAPETDEIPADLGDFYFQSKLISNRVTSRLSEPIALSDDDAEDALQHQTYTLEMLPYEQRTTFEHQGEAREEGDIAAHLKRNPVFRCLSWVERQWLEENVRVSFFAADDVILPETHEGESLFVILDGHASIVTPAQGHQARVLTTLAPQEFFGEIALLMDQPSGASVVAASECSIIEIPKPVLATVIKKHPSIAEILRETSRRRLIDTKLAHVSLFTHLNTSERQQIADFLSPTEFKQGAVILAEGDVGDYMYIIRSGTVEVYTRLLSEQEGAKSADGEDEQLLLATLHDGDFFGEQALLTNERRNATVIAATDTQLLRFSKPDLEAILRRYPRVGEMLKRYHHQRTTDTLDSLHDAFQRLMAYYHPNIPPSELEF
ncbi:cyclic nucleotide-binding protein [Candidatus Moduliflexus flocculans]|uniref:Cyclic nucleotide-binding protein n=1 Tax=Candidatus Moduliflexus flocculans TaxID=1499966 RepID=A0A0S6VQL3_9BACT|nr:cyclic nucleotide-binding protein [Candidatus Moduliflexus flocculans]